MLRPAFAGSLALVAFTTELRAEPAAVPAYKPLRYDEDFSPLRDASQRRESLDELKFIPLGLSDFSWLTLGGESRSRYEYFRHPSWGQGPQDNNGYFLQRTMLHADWHVDSSTRFFVQLKSGLENGREGGPRSTDEDRLDLNQAFVDVKLPASAGSTITLRFGRQEMAFGSSRLISFRESPNVRLAFDGARLTWAIAGWKLDALAVEPMQTKPGVFDDGNDPHQKLWGLYAVAPLRALPGGHVDFYYLGLQRDTARFDQGTAREERHTLGSRLWGTSNGWDYNFEFLFQFGTLGPNQIAAWSVASDTGYTFVAAPTHPRLSLKADIVSGDRDPHRGTLNTFNALFPRGAYFNESALIGPANLIDVHPALEVHPGKNVSVSVDWDFFWRESTADGIYGPAVNLVRSGRTNDSRTIGQQPSVRTDWRPGRHWTLSATAAHFIAGDFIRRSGPSQDVDYFSSWITYVF